MESEFAKDVLEDTVEQGTIRRKSTSRPAHDKADDKADRFHERNMPRHQIKAIPARPFAVDVIWPVPSSSALHSEPSRAEPSRAESLATHVRDGIGPPAVVRASTSRRCAQVQPHLYGELAKTAAGCKVRRARASPGASVKSHAAQFHLANRLRPGVHWSRLGSSAARATVRVRL